MAIVNVSLDTGTRQVILTIDGIMVPATDVFIEKFIFEDRENISFAYTIENVNGDGMKERRQFFLPSPEELAVNAHSEINDNGFASKVVRDDEKAKADVINYLKQGR